MSGIESTGSATTRHRTPRVAARRYLVSVLAFGTKGAGAILVTYWVANALSVADFALWATVFSIGMILSVADLGVGQLVLTSLHERRSPAALDGRLMGTAVVAMAVLASGLFVVGLAVLIGGEVLPSLRAAPLILALMVLRLPFIPLGAALAAADRYHERKVFEAVSYGLGAGFVYWATRQQAGVSTLLAGMTTLITLGSIGAAARAVQLGVVPVRWRGIDGRGLRAVLTGAFPYFVNNASGLVIYGGFIALSSLVLNDAATARLSILHSLVLMHLYQAFELVFRTAQVRLHDEVVMKRLQWLVGAGYIVLLPGLALGGPWFFHRFFATYEYRSAELAIYVTFTFLEIYYLLLTSRIQMRSALRNILQRLSVVKTAGFAAVLIAMMALPTRPGLLPYAILLTLYSALLALVSHFWARAGASVRRA